MPTGRDYATFSANGRYLVFVSRAWNLTPEAHDVGEGLIYMKDLQTGSIKVVTIAYSPPRMVPGGIRA